MPPDRASMFRRPPKRAVVLVPFRPAVFSVAAILFSCRASAHDRHYGRHDSKHQRSHNRQMPWLAEHVTLYAGSFGHRVNANTHSPTKFTSGMNARIVHHRLRPARCKMLEIGTPTMMIIRIGMMMAITACHSGGSA
jgi:hypothetical protein